jgi:hypothetical protein
VEEDIRQEIDGEIEMFVEHFGAEACVFSRRVGIHAPAHRIDGPGDVLSITCLGALKEEVLDEVGDAVLRY